MKTRAAVLRAAGRPAPFARSVPLSIEDLDLESPGPGEVLVEVAAAGLCHSDLSVIDGSRPRPLPMVLGHEASGIVRETGPGVGDLRPGDPVVFSFVAICGRCGTCADGLPFLCENGVAANVAGTLLGGSRRFSDPAGTRVYHHLGISAFSQFTVAAQESLVKVDLDLPLDKAALFGCAVMTGVGAVLNTAHVEPGHSVAVFGLGGVGLSIVMGACAAGADPIVAVDVREAKLGLARQAGATHGVDAAKTDAVQAVRDLTRGGARFAFESAGQAGVLEQAYRATRRGGTTVTVGLPPPAQLLSIPALSLTSEGRTLKGSFMGSCTPRRDIPRFIEMHRAGRLPVDLLHSRSLPLEEINAGFDALAAAEGARQIVRFGA